MAGAKFLDWLDVPKGLRWIDVGCGNGAFTEVLIARCSPAAVTGIDTRRTVSLPTRAHGPARRWRNSASPTRKACRSPTKASTPPPMALVITFLPDPLKAAAEMARVVDPGGLGRDLHVGRSDGRGLPLGAAL